MYIRMSLFSYSGDHKAILPFCKAYIAAELVTLEKPTDIYQTSYHVLVTTVQQNAM